jgi:type VI secretion system lysozyme-like protein
MSSSLAAPDYGLPDIGETMHSFPKTISVLAQSLAALIRKYETRLVDVRVEHVPSETVELTIRYSITARLAVDRATPVTFETRIDTTRHVSIT